MEVRNEVVAWTLGVLALGGSVVAASQFGVLAAPPTTKTLAAPTVVFDDTLPFESPKAFSAESGDLAFVPPAAAPVVPDPVIAVAPALVAPVTAPPVPVPVAARPAAVSPVAAPVRPAAAAPLTYRVPGTVGAARASSPRKKQTPSAVTAPAATWAAAPKPGPAGSTQPEVAPAFADAAPAPTISAATPPTAVASQSTPAPAAAVSAAVATGSQATPAPSAAVPVARTAAPVASAPVTLPTIPTPPAAPLPSVTAAPVVATTAVAAATVAPATTAVPVTTVPVSTTPATTIAPTTVAPPTTIAGFAIVVVPSQGSAIADASPLSYPVGNAGTAIVQVLNGKIELLAVVPAPGVIAAVTSTGPTALSVAFSAPAGSGAASITFTLTGTLLSYSIKG